MKKSLYILLIILSPIALVAQLSDKGYNAVEDFYEEINIDYIDFNLKEVEFDYNKNYIKINTVIKYNYGLVCSDTGKVLSRSYLTDNKIPVKLRKKGTYYLRLDTPFSSRYYKIRI